MIDISEEHDVPNSKNILSGDNADDFCPNDVENVLHDATQDTFQVGWGQLNVDHRLSAYEDYDRSSWTGSEISSDESEENDLMPVLLELLSIDGQSNI